MCFYIIFRFLGHQGASTVSWEHFFTSLQQYFSNLRQEMTTPMNQMLPSTDTIYRMGRPMTKGISPAEIQGLMTVLRLIQQVADNCEAARVAMAENSNWQPLLVILGKWKIEAIHGHTGNVFLS